MVSQSSLNDGDRRLLITGASGFIGTNLADRLQRDHIRYVNLDRAAPLDETHAASWEPCDILDRERLKEAFLHHAPTDVIHLAARVDCDEKKSLAGYRQNTDGTANVLEAVKATPSVERLIITSSQFVCQPGCPPAHDQDYAPHTVYGLSKVITEELTRGAKLSCVWTIARPTTIWGPWQLRHQRQLFPVMQRGLYVHPGRQLVIRSWGYVGNVVSQLLAILGSSPSLVDRQTFYLGDAPSSLLHWVNAVSARLTGRPVRTVPRSLVRVVALVGDAFALCGRRFPITSSRYRSMTEDYLTPMEKTFDRLGPPPVSLEEGVDATIAWYETQRGQPNGRDFTIGRRDGPHTQVEQQLQTRKGQHEPIL